jgi:excinuclease ABC subunit C
MASPTSYRPAPGSVPDAPGVYRFRDDEGRVIYVGKAKSLRSRLQSYFADPLTLHARTHAMVTSAASVEWTVVGTEVEALQLEYTWIKEFDPRFNVRYRDDKSYPYLAVALSDQYPRALVMRGTRKPGVRYFGPYSHAWAIRETLDLLLRVFPVRTCSEGVFRRAHRSGRPCLLGDIGKCSAPCVGRVDEIEHRQIAEDLCSFLAGGTARFQRELEREMRFAAENEEFERAARLRDDLRAVNQAVERNAVVLPPGTDADVVAFADDPLEAAVQVFFVRDGRVRGQRGWIVERVEDIGLSGLVEQFIQQTYGAGLEVPREVLVPELPADDIAVREWLSGLRGSLVDIRIPQRGAKRDLLETVRRNAEQSLMLHKVRRAGDLTSRSVALREVQEALDLESAPLRIECYDISHLHGQDVVASMVVFEDGLAKKSDYRRFNIQAPGGDDVAAMQEVITRRFKRLADAIAAGELGAGDPGFEAPPAGEAHDDDPTVRRRFSYRPNLVVVDGAGAQVEAAMQGLRNAGVAGIAVCGLAKRLEEVWLPGNPDPVIMSRTSEGLYLLQRVRDEAHRFAITGQRARRTRKISTSVLEEVPGLGPSRAKALIKAFGSVKKLRGASVEQIQSVQGIGPAIAVAVHAALASQPPPKVINTATGEIVDPTPPAATQERSQKEAQ